MEKSSKRKRIKELEVMVAEVMVETADTTTLRFFTGNDRLDYLPGHFLTIDPRQFAALERFTSFLEDKKGKKEPPRAYSLTSSPHEKYLAITVKEERYTSGRSAYPPLLSPLLVRRIPIGTRMIVTGFTGPYTLKDDIVDETDHIIHICAGSGSVPNFSILKHCLANDLPLKHTFIYGNKTFDDIIFENALRNLQQSYPKKLKLVHALTRENDVSSLPGDFRKGRVTQALLENVIEDDGRAAYFVCGPGLTRWEKKKAKEEGLELRPRFMESTLEALKAMGIDKKRLHRESYG